MEDFLILRNAALDHQTINEQAPKDVLAGSAIFEDLMEMNMDAVMSAHTEKVVNRHVQTRMLNIS
jgi:hypothetical protein